MAFCNACKNQVPDGTKFCPYCGEPILQQPQQRPAPQFYAQDEQPAEPAKPNPKRPATVVVNEEPVRQQPQYQQPIPPQGYPGAPAPGYQQNYGPVVQPPQPPMPQQPPMPPQPQYPPQGASTTQPQQPTVFSQPGAEYDPSNYPDDLPADFGPMR